MKNRLHPGIPLITSVAFLLIVVIFLVVSQRRTEEFRSESGLSFRQVVQWDTTELHQTTAGGATYITLCNAGCKRDGSFGMTVTAYDSLGGYLRYVAVPAGADGEAHTFATLDEYIAYQQTRWLNYNLVGTRVIAGEQAKIYQVNSEGWVTIGLLYQIVKGDRLYEVLVPLRGREVELSYAERTVLESLQLP